MKIHVLPDTTSNLVGNNVLFQSTTDTHLSKTIIVRAQISDIKHLILKICN